MTDRAGGALPPFFFPITTTQRGAAPRGWTSSSANSSARGRESRFFHDWMTVSGSDQEILRTFQGKRLCCRCCRRDEASLHLHVHTNALEYVVHRDEHPGRGASARRRLHRHRPPAQPSRGGGGQCQPHPASVFSECSDEHEGGGGVFGRRG